MHVSHCSLPSISLELTVSEVLQKGPTTFHVEVPLEMQQSSVDL